MAAVKKIRKKISVLDEKIYHAIFTNSFDAILLTVPEGKILAANPAACRMFGRSEEEICRLGRGGIMNSADSRLAEALGIRKNTGSFSGNLTCVRKNGTIFPVELSTAVFTDEQGNLKTSMIIRDVSRREKLIQELEDKEANLRSIIENSNGSIWSVDREMRLVECNSSFVTNFYSGTGRHIRKGDKVLDFIPDAIKKEWKEYHKRGLSGEQFEITASTVKPLKPQQFRYNFNPVRDKEGNITGLTVVGNNITSLIGIQEDLRKIEERLRQITESTGEWIWETDKNGKYTYVSPLSTSLLGYTPEEIVGKKYFYDFFVPGKKKRLKNAALKTFREKKVFTGFENPNLHRDGHVVILETSGFPIINKKGQLIGYRGVDKDVTAKKKTEKQLRDSEERYRMLAEQGGIGIGLYDYNGKILYYNNKALRNLGGKAEDYIGRSLIETFGEEAGNKYLRRVRMAVKTGKACDYEDEFESPSGKYCFLSNHSPAYDSAGNIIGVQVIAHDITERKKAEYELIMAERRYRTLFEKSVVPIWEEDFSEVKKYFDSLRNKGVKDFRRYFTKFPERAAACASLIRITDINHTSVTFFGLKNKSEISRNLPVFFCEESFSCFVEEMIVLAEGKKEFECDIPLKMPGGKIKYAHLKLQVQPDHYDSLSQVLVSWVDISDRINYEEELKKSEEALRQLNMYLEEAREKERSAIALNLHDDLGQKLTALRMDLSWLKKRIGVQSGMVNSKIDTMDRMINTLVGDIQKISSELRPGILFDLGLKEAVEWLLAQNLEPAGIKTSFRMSPSHLQIDEKKSIVLFRIIQEAVTNIVRHSGALNAYVRITASSSYINVLIKDDGSGIDESKVLSPDSFGLVSIRERVKALSGEMHITGISGKGTILRAKIPRN